MQSIRGRIAQYKILLKEQALHPYLIPNERFSKITLFSMLEKHNDIMLKPIVGMDYITVSKEQQHFNIVANGLSSVVMDLEELYETLQQQMTKQNYVIQPLSNVTHIYKKNYRCFITVQKRGTNWQITSSTNKFNHRIQTIAYSKIHVKLQKIAQVVAKQLGEFYPKCESIVVEFLFNLKGDLFITDSLLHFSVSKWNQYQSISQFMPKTDLLTIETFQNFLTNYPIVFIKPCNGQQGKGIIKISRVAFTTYLVEIGRRRWIKQSIQEVYEHTRALLQVEKNYIIQQGIPLATVDNNFTDLRVMTQKVGDEWHVTGKVVKIAGPHFFVTNAAQKVLMLEDALEQSTIPVVFHRQLEERIDAICITAAKMLDEQKERTIIGFDVGVTNLGHIWIIEGNYVPDLSFFKDLEDQSMYKTILKNRQLFHQPSEQG